MYPFFYDATMVVLIPAIILVMWAQYKVKATYNKYSQYGNQRGYTGAQVARDILDRAGLRHVRIERVAGQLSDHYDPQSQVVRLSSGVHDSSSLAAIGVAAHETGHAIQHAESYAPLGIRNAIVPAANIGTQIGPILAIVGLFFRSPNMIMLGILLYLGAVVFTLMTLPVEFNASSRAMAILEHGSYLGREELSGARKVLNAAAMTYVAAALMALAQLLRLLMIFGMANGRRRD